MTNSIHAELARAVIAKLKATLRNYQDVVAVEGWNGDADAIDAVNEALCDLDDVILAWGQSTADDAAGVITAAGRLLQGVCHTAGAKWHNNPATGQPYTPADHDERFPLYIVLIHSELSEALEGHRRGLQDDHLPHRSMMEAELADAWIRIGNTAGAMNFDLGATVAEKLQYNAPRADHQAAAHGAVGGKKY